ncbi:MAG: IS30 family transposase [Methylobacter sp.]|nr:MAG: IS30 family transposase [Methylobacter sp.]
MKGYNQLTQATRYQIGILLKAGKTQKAIAELVNVSPGTICRELKRNTGKRGYSPRQAQLKTETRRQLAVKALKMDTVAIGLIESKIRDDWSPEQVSGWLKQAQGLTISHERIYQHVWADKLEGGQLYKHLRHSGKKRKRYGSKDKRGQIRNRISIDDRPDIVNEKTRLGDWEIDTVIGKNHQGALVTIVDRVSKFTLIKKVTSKQADVVAEATITLLQPYRDKTTTITADNGKEFAGHEKIKAALDADIYFAHPYRSWERGLNENTNGLIRQYFTKGSSFENITDGDIAAVMEKLNHRPRKTLNYKTPHAVFFADILLKAA